MKIQEDRSNIIKIPFLHFQNHSGYQYRIKLKKELSEARDRLVYSKASLSQSDDRALQFAEGYCRGFIDGVHQVMSELEIKKLEVQLATISELKTTLLKDLETQEYQILEGLRRLNCETKRDV